MDIYSKKGTIVTPRFKKGKLQGGYEIEAARASRYLEEGKKYTVDHTVVHAWSTEVYLKEFPGISFNSVHFK